MSRKTFLQFFRPDKKFFMQKKRKLFYLKVFLDHLVVLVEMHGDPTGHEQKNQQILKKVRQVDFSNELSAFD